MSKVIFVLYRRADLTREQMAEHWSGQQHTSDEAMQQALNSPEMGAAVEDAKRFLDMEKTGLIIVEEKPVIGLAHP